MPGSAEAGFPEAVTGYLEKDASHPSALSQMQQLFSLGVLVPGSDLMYGPLLTAQLIPDQSADAAQLRRASIAGL